MNGRPYIVDSMRYFSHLQTAAQMIEQYKGDQPFSHFTKSYFGQFKKFGSNDRRSISRLCYSFFRLGKAMPELPVQDRILAGLFLCSPEPNEVLAQLKPEWNELAGISLPEKYIMLNGTTASAVPSLEAVFPWKEALSEGIDYPAFLASFFIQPDLFLRIRPGKKAAVTQKLNEAGVSFTPVSDTCLSLPNTTKADRLLDMNREAVVQDYSSQQVGNLLRTALEKQTAVTGKTGPSVWDCCAGSGGKSIMAWDVASPLKLTVSDIRESILINLQKRFQEAGIAPYTAFTADLSDPRSLHNTNVGPFHLVMADVPCTGSGTWSRTPEQLYFFDPTAVEEYSKRQQRIVQRAISFVKPGGHFLYITCSVFRKENEDVVAFIQQNSALQLQQQELLTGYHKKADTLFAALFQLPQ